MIYWHVERGAVRVYSQLKSCSSSEVAAMMECVLHHCTEMTVERQYVDSLISIPWNGLSRVCGEGDVKPLPVSDISR